MKVSNTALVVSLLSLLATSAAADSIDTAFTGRYNNPEDVFVLGDYVQTATRAGQYDQAISSIEEHLVRFANDGRARLAVARLYANVGSWELAANQAQAALESGQLSMRETQEAQALLRRASQGAKGIEWFVEASTGVRIIHIDVNVPTGSWRDRTTTGAYGELSGAFRYDFGTALGNALILSGRLGVERGYQDAYQGAGPSLGRPDGRIANSFNGRAAATFDFGLPVTAIDAMRLQLGVFTDYATVHPGIRIHSVGGIVRTVIIPTVDTRFHAEYSYEDFSASTGINAQRRHKWETGGSYRISQAHAVGVAARGLYDYSAANAMTGRVEEGEIYYAGRLPFEPFGVVWTHDVSLSVGTFTTSGLPPGPATVFTGSHWRAEWNHQFHIDGHNRIDLGYSVTENRFDQAAAVGRNSRSHAVSLGYTHRF